MVKWMIITTANSIAWAYDVLGTVLSTLNWLISLDPPNNPVEKVLLLFPFYR